MALRWLLWQARSQRWLCDERTAISRERLEAFRQRHRGERCFILGNGPSLARMDLTPLRHEITFGLNRIYLLFPKVGFATTYLVAINALVIRQCAGEIDGLRIPRFLSWHARDAVTFDDHAHLLRTHWRPLGFSTEPADFLYEGATVTFVAMQLAYFMGFAEVILIGVDHSFATRGQPHRAVTSRGADPNHFDPNYFGKGFRWQLPDLETSELAYRLAGQSFAADGRKIVDATVGGKLDVFPKVEFNALF